MRYYIYNEDGELMRKVARQEEALHIIKSRGGWYFKRVKKPRQGIDWSAFEPALF